MPVPRFTIDDLTAILQRADAAGDAERAALAAECIQRRTRPHSDTITAGSGVSASTGAGFVWVTWGDMEAQVDPSIAKGLGASITDAAYSAEHDAHFVAFLASIGLTPPAVAAALDDLRTRRQRADEQRPA